MTSKLVLAPMATLSHEALRLLIHRYGDPDEYFSEMIHAPSFVHGGRFEEWYVRTAPAPEKIVWQITGSTAEPMARAAGMLARLGGIGVDLNMGCSAPDIAKTGAGVAWMLKPPEEAALLVKTVRRELDARVNESHLAEAPFRLSVKLRLGADEDYPRLLSFCRILVECGVELITLHPRIKKDKYGRPARREYVARLASDLTVPVYGNGDVDSPEDACGYLAKYPCAGLMLGRSAVQKPWIFADIRNALERNGTGAKTGFAVAGAGSGAESHATAGAGNGGAMRDSAAGSGILDHLEVAEFFLSVLRASQPGEFLLSRAHRFFFYYCDNFRFAHHIKMRIQNAKAPDEIGGLLAQYFAQVPEDRYLRRQETGF